jgi:hypothetical protein
MSDRDIVRFHNTLAKQLFPKYKDFLRRAYFGYKKENLKEEYKDIHGRFPVTKDVLHEIIYALEWELSTNMYVSTKKQNDFYIKYYGKTPYNNCKEYEDIKYWDESAYDKKLVDEARERGQKGFELLGRYFTALGED